MTYKANVVGMRSDDTLEVTLEMLKDAFLVEFAEIEINEFLMDTEDRTVDTTEPVPGVNTNDTAQEELISVEEDFSKTRPTIGAKGLHIVRAISTDKVVVSTYNEKLGFTPLDFIGPKGAIFFTVRPSETFYTWTIMKVSPPDSTNRMMEITACRRATEDEHALLSSYFPKWLDEAEALDKRIAEEKRLETERRMLALKMEIK